MSYRNHIFLNNPLDEPIYRIFSKKRFIQILTEKKLTLSKPKMWDDPFENMLLSSDFQSGSDTCKFATANSVYGQCWTSHSETDAMWRIYSSDKLGVRVMTTPRKLLESLKKEVAENHELRCYIGKVQYITEDKLEEAFSKVELKASNGSGIAESLLYKRKEFEHEAEIRLIYVGQDGQCKENYFGYNIQINSLFESIMFDPRLPDDLKNSHVTEFKNLNCSLKIENSTLYNAPPNILRNFK